MQTSACEQGKHRQCRGRVLDLVARSRKSPCDCTCGHPWSPQNNRLKRDHSPAAHAAAGEFGNRVPGCPGCQA